MDAPVVAEHDRDDHPTFGWRNHDQRTYHKVMAKREPAERTPAQIAEQEARYQVWLLLKADPSLMFTVDTLRPFDAWVTVLTKLQAGYRSR